MFSFCSASSGIWYKNKTYYQKIKAKAHV